MKTIFGHSVPVPIRCDQCRKVSECIALEESVSRVTGRYFLCVSCVRENERHLLDRIMNPGADDEYPS